MQQSEYLKASQVAAIVGVARSTLYQMMKDPTFPQPFRPLPRCPRWREEDVRAWVEAN